MGTALQRHLNLEVVKCVVVASPGFVKDQFLAHFFAQATREANKPILDARSPSLPLLPARDMSESGWAGKFVAVHASSGFKHSLNEVLADPAIVARLADTKAAAEVGASLPGERREARGTVA